jgi:uncharacterized membrane protein
VEFIRLSGGVGDASGIGGSAFGGASSLGGSALGGGTSSGATTGGHLGVEVILCLLNSGTGGGLGSGELRLGLVKLVTSEIVKACQHEVGGGGRAGRWSRASSSSLVGTGHEGGHLLLQGEQLCSLGGESALQV